MRFWVIGISALALAACGSSEAPVTDEMQDVATAETAAEIDPSQITLNGDGLTVGAESFYFNAGQTEVEAALARALGKPGESIDMPECGAGPMASSTYGDALTANYQDGKLVGWFLRDEAEKIALSGGAGVGAPRADVEILEGFAMIEGSTLGEEFYAEAAGIGGFFGEEGAVSELYAGTQCFFR
jgi:hypothetical protein